MTDKTDVTWRQAGACVVPLLFGYFLDGPLGVLMLIVGFLGAYLLLWLTEGRAVLTESTTQVRAMAAAGTLFLLKLATNWKIALAAAVIFGLIFIGLKLLEGLAKKNPTQT